MNRLFKQAVIVCSLLFLFVHPALSQETSVCNLIGKDVNNVIKTFGKPLHTDKSNPTMQCVYYQSSKARMAFVADKSGVYQIQQDYYYNSKDAAAKAINNFISNCYSKSMQVDTVNVSEFKIYGSGIRVNLTLFENNFSKKYEVQLKADRSENK